jgi:5-methylcytosine-specific restriction endonuclease McrA
LLVIKKKEYLKKKSSIRYSKQNVFLRDGYRCAYCETDVSRKTATLDHVLPVSKGGKTTFDNTVCACGPCNASKGANHRIKPKIKPHKPDYWELLNRRKEIGFTVPHDSWRDYLG